MGVWRGGQFVWRQAPKQTNARRVSLINHTPAMVRGDASASSSKSAKRKPVNHVATTSKKQRTVAQAGSPEWPSYFHDVRRLSLPATLHPIEFSPVIQGACFVLYAHVLFLSTLPSHHSRCTRYVCTMDFPAHGLDTRQALNTVLAFCSSRKSMAPTFDSIRGSVESLLKGWVPPTRHRGSTDSRIGR